MPAAAPSTAGNEPASRIRASSPRSRSGDRAPDRRSSFASGNIGRERELSQRRLDVGIGEQSPASAGEIEGGPGEDRARVLRRSRGRRLPAEPSGKHRELDPLRFELHGFDLVTQRRSPRGRERGSAPISSACADAEGLARSPDPSRRPGRVPRSNSRSRGKPRAILRDVGELGLQASAQIVIFATTLVPLACRS
jgi:hypothetical protein